MVEHVNMSTDFTWQEAFFEAQGMRVEMFDFYHRRRNIMKYIRSFAMIFMLCGFTSILFAQEKGIKILQLDPPHSGITFSKAMPVEKETIQVRVKLANDTQKEVKGVVVRFYQEEKGSSRSLLIGEQKVNFSAESEPVSIEQKWTTSENGFYIVRVLLDPDNRVSGASKEKSMEREIPVLAKDLTFHFWRAPQWMKYPTVVMTKKEDIPYWQNRGVVPGRWAWGYAAGKMKWTEKNFVDSWTQYVKDKWPAICIDEFGGGTRQIDIDMRNALIATKKAEPDLLLTIWVTSLADPVKEAFQEAADLVMVERYITSFTGYRGFTTQWEKAVELGIAHKTILTLGLGRWVTHEQELISQIEYIKKLLPQVPGLGFFSTAEDHLNQAIDRAIYDYFLKPVVWIEKSEKDTVTIINTGGMDAKNVEVVFGKGAIKQRVPLIKVNSRTTLKMPAGYSDTTITKSDRYTVLD